MNGLHIYEISKQAQFESNYDIELQRMSYEDQLIAPRRSLVARLGNTLRRGLAALRIVHAEPTRS